MTNRNGLKRELEELECRLELALRDIADLNLTQLFGFAAMKLIEARDKWDAIPTLHKGYHESQLVKADLDRWQAVYDRKLEGFQQRFYLDLDRDSL